MNTPSGPNISWEEYYALQGRLTEAQMRALDAQKHHTNLLAACKMALKSFEWVNGIMTGGDNFVPQREALRRAIAEAEAK